MGQLAVLALRAVIVVGLALSLFVDVVVLPAVWRDFDEADAPSWAQLTVVALAALLILTIQVTAVCVWRLLTMVRRGTVFSPAAFRYVDIVFGALIVAALCVFGFAVALAPGDAAPGIVLIVCGVSLAVGGVALIVLVLRMLLLQAVATTTEAQQLRDELDEVI